MRDTLTVLRKIYLFYPVQNTTVILLRMFGFAGLGVLTGVFIKRYFDEASGQAFTLNGLLFLTAMLVAVPLVQAITYYIDLGLSYGRTEIVRAIFRRNILREIFKRPGALPLPVEQGQMMNIMRSDVTVHEGLYWDLTYLSAFAVFSTGGLIMLGSVDWLVTVILFAPLPAIIMIVKWLEKQITAYYQAERMTTDRVLGVISDIFNYSQALKINKAERPFLKRLAVLGEERARAGRRNAVFTTALASIYDNIVNIGIALLLLLLSDKLRNGSFSIGSFTLFVFFLGYISNFTRLFGKVLTSFKSSALSLNRIEGVIGERYLEKLTQSDSLFLTSDPPNPPDEPDESCGPLLENMDIDGLSYTFPNSKQGIRNISFSIRQGSFTVITGKMGSGKTTLLRVMLGLLPKASGEIKWNGKLVPNAADFFVPPNVAYTPQVPYLFSDTIKANILLGYPDESRITAALHQSVLEEDMNRLEMGTDTLLGTKGVNLSGGQLQRTAAARMFVRDAQLLVMDDISSALDVDTEMRLWERLNELRSSKGVTLLVVTQKEYALKYADLVIVLENGEMKRVN